MCGAWDCAEKGAPFLPSLDTPAIVTEHQRLMHEKKAKSQESLREKMIQQALTQQRKEKKLQERHKKNVKLHVRTKKGQPVMQHQARYFLEKVQKALKE